MDQSLLPSPPRTPAARVRSVFAWPLGVACFGLLFLVLGSIAHQMLAADAEENKVCSFEEPATPLQGAALLAFFRERAPASIQCAQLDDFESPDGITYDPVDHKIFVSDPGAPPDDCDPKLPLAQ